ncbi:C-factor-like [Varanus komodoensis]|uniref:C-factor-like n=1 Tax=Varanus komodoensis TaxID=61221 RepID=UPI001CF7DF6E|nr:C-factor-like [Varanus komodoensis]
MATTSFILHSVLVTGSSSGIGLGLVKQFLTLPIPPRWVFATSREMDGPKCKEIKVLLSQYQNLVLLQLDVTDLKSIRAAVEEVRKHVGERGLTLLVNGAGIMFFSSLQTENAKDMVAEYTVNTVGPLQVSQEFLPLLKMAAKRSLQEGLSCSKAAIVNLSSNGGSIELMPKWDKTQNVGYRCSKAALNMLTKCQSMEYPNYGILCVSVYPGFVRTKLTMWQGDLSVEESVQEIINVLSTLSEVDNGTFIDWEGRRLPW